MVSSLHISILYITLATLLKNLEPGACLLRIVSFLPCGPQVQQKYVLRYILDTSIYILYIIYLTDYLSPLKPSAPGYMSSSYQVYVDIVYLALCLKQKMRESKWGYTTI